MQIVPQILSCFKISRIRLLALQCSKKVINPIILTEYSLFSKNLQCSPNHHFRRKIQHFSGKDTDNKYRLECTKTPFQVKNSFFLRRGQLLFLLIQHLDISTLTRTFAARYRANALSFILHHLQFSILNRLAFFLIALCA